MIRDEEFEGAERLLSEYKGMARTYEKTGHDVNSLDEHYRAAIEEDKHRRKKIDDTASRFIGNLKKEIIGEAFGKAFELLGQKNTAPPEPAPDTQAVEQRAARKLPPVIQAVLDEELLDNTPVNGKYPKKGDRKDGQIIEWIFDYSGYGDSLTTELYMQYIQTHCKTTTIQDYITRKRKTPD
jgi:hypothetical protein